MKENHSQSQDGSFSLKQLDEQLPSIGSQPSVCQPTPTLFRRSSNNPEAPSNRMAKIREEFDADDQHDGQTPKGKYRSPFSQDSHVDQNTGFSFGRNQAPRTVGATPCLFGANAKQDTRTQAETDESNQMESPLKSLGSNELHAAGRTHCKDQELSDTPNKDSMVSPNKVIYKETPEAKAQDNMAWSPVTIDPTHVSNNYRPLDSRMPTPYPFQALADLQQDGMNTTPPQHGRGTQGLRQGPAMPRMEEATSVQEMASPTSESSPYGSDSFIRTIKFVSPEDQGKPPEVFEKQRQRKSQPTSTPGWVRDIRSKGQASEPEDIEKKVKGRQNANAYAEFMNHLISNKGSLASPGVHAQHHAFHARMQGQLDDRSMEETEK